MMEGMEKMEAEKQACANVIRCKWVEGRTASKTDVAFEQIHEGRGARIVVDCRAEASDCYHLQQIHQY